MINARSLFLGALLSVLPLGSIQGAGVQSPGSDLLRAPDGTFYGTSAEGGASSAGTIFRITRDSELTILFSFTGNTGAIPGSQPTAGLVRGTDGLFWGTTKAGGANGKGTIFKCIIGTLYSFEHVADFSGTNGGTPLGALVSDGAGLLWGTTSEGGANNLGTVFCVSESTGTLTTKVEFTGTNGAAVGSGPAAALFRDAGGVLWGTTSHGGALDLGTIFKYDPATNGGTFTSVAEFTGTNGNAPGAAPLAAFIDAGSGILWSTTSVGGSGGLGTVFKFNTATSAVSTVADFTGANGQNPKGRLYADGLGFFYGTASGGGANSQGTIFKVDAATGALTTLDDLTGTTGLAKGSFPLAGLTPDAQGQLWGTASQGGREDLGTIFKIDPTSGLYTLLAEPNPSPSPPSATATPPPASTTSGPAGATVDLKGTAKDNTEVLSVLVSLNGGPFVPATLLPPTKPGGPLNWKLTVTPENGVNVVVVKSIDNGGDGSKAVTFSFNYTVTRPELAGAYNGLVQAAAASTTPLLHTGVFTLKVLPTGRFTGKLTLAGPIAPLALTGSIGNDGTVRFGKTGATFLILPRKNLSPLLLALSIDVTVPLARQVTGLLRENGIDVATAIGDQALYTNKKNPVSPFLNVPTTLLDPATDKGAYTALVLPLTPALQGLAATDFPQGSGYALGKIATTGIVKFTGKLADGTPFTASNALSQGNSVPIFARLYGTGGAICGFVTFEDEPGQSDADGSLEWYKLANAKSPSYRNGWPLGIGTEFRASRFVAPKISGNTLLGNPPGATNADLTLSSATLATLANDLSIPLTGPVVIGSAPALPVGSIAATNLHLTLAATGQFTGSFLDSLSGKVTPFVGAVLQKSATAVGYFLQNPATGAPKTDPKSSGLVDIEAK